MMGQRVVQRVSGSIQGQPIQQGIKREMNSIQNQNDKRQRLQSQDCSLD